jgi:beta-lactamase regulating signal transducer with metallopeptidase domain
MAMLHSFWQAAFLLLLYVAVDKIIHRNNAPLAKRNFLYAAIATQLVLFALTFSIYFFNSTGTSTLAGITQNISGYLGNENLQAITPWIFSLYVFIIAYKLIKAIYSWYHFKKQYRTGLQKPAVELKLFTELKAHQFGIKRKVKLWLSNSIQTPITFGFFKPIILLPVALLNNISTQQAETLIVHELTHIYTNDYLLNWFLMAAETIFFFNPFVSRLCKNIRLEREKNCDIHVVSFKYSPALYAETLLQAERLKQLVPDFQLAAVNRKKHLLQRIQYFTSEKIINQGLRFNIVAPLIGLVLLLLLSTSVLFQSGKTALPTQSSSDIHHLPFSNYIISDTEFDNDFLPESLTTEPLTEQKSLKQPVIENKIIVKPEPAAKPQQQIIEEILKPVDINFALPVATRENDAARQIIIQEEGSGSASLKVYYLSFENGSWILQPEWVITAKEVILDSVSRNYDSSLKNKLRRTYPDQQ